MKFCPLKTAEADDSALAAEYRSGKKLDVLRLGENHLFFRKKLSVYYLAYEELDRFFRRVLMVPMRVSCCKSEMPVEHIVLCADGKELAVLLLADPRMAPPVIEALKERAPNAKCGKPAAVDGGENG